MKKKALCHTIMWLSVPMTLDTSVAHAAEARANAAIEARINAVVQKPRIFNVQDQKQAGVQIHTETYKNDKGELEVQTISADYSRLQGAGLLLNETMLGSMDEPGHGCRSP
jgi:hypothetical protein